MTNGDDDYFEDVKSVIEKSAASGAEKARVLAGLWTLNEIPEITSAAQYEQYAKLADELYKNANIPEKGDPGYGAAFRAFSNREKGYWPNAYGARMIEWEQRQEE
jgi:hypothetical protein